MKKVMVVSRVPDEDEKSNTGGMSRIMVIDKLLASSCDITYVDFKKKKMFNSKKKEYVAFSLMAVFRSFIKSDYVYIHAFANMLRILPYLMLMRKKIVFDLHGAALAEELQRNNYFNASLFFVFQRLMFAKADKVVTVTKAMADYFEGKYPSIGKKILVMPIVNKLDVFPANEKTLQDIAKIEKKEEELLVIYSGGVQVWQNAELMIKLANQNLDSKIKFLFLSKEEEYFKTRIDTELLDKNVFVFSSAREQLSHYYEISDLGMMLRENDVVNRVAFPTKLFEYIYFNTVPLVLNPEVGDFKKLGINGVLLNEFSEITKEKLGVMVKKNVQSLDEINSIYDQGLSEIKEFFEK